MAGRDQKTRGGACLGRCTSGGSPMSCRICGGRSSTAGIRRRRTAARIRAATVARTRHGAGRAGRDARVLVGMVLSIWNGKPPGRLVGKEKGRTGGLRGRGSSVAAKGRRRDGALRRDNGREFPWVVSFRVRGGYAVTHVRASRIPSRSARGDLPATPQLTFLNKTGCGLPAPCRYRSGGEMGNDTRGLGRGRGGMGRP